MQKTRVEYIITDIITQARAPSTRQLYALKWCLFASWRSSFSLKIAVMTMLTSIKRGWGLARPRPGYVPNFPTNLFRDQVVNLQVLPHIEADSALSLLCTVHALWIYLDRTENFRCSEQLYVCFRGQQKGEAVSKKRIAHWIVEASSLAYRAQSIPYTLRVQAHSTRCVASSWALANCASLTGICRTDGWAIANTLTRYYNL